ncbi:hypothetical protein H5410_028313, partial [Solanum commersonii]
MRRIGKVAYELELPSLNGFGSSGDFHVYLCWRRVGDPMPSPLDVTGVVEDNLTYEEVPIRILDRQSFGEINKLKVLLGRKPGHAKAISLSFPLHSKLK